MPVVSKQTLQVVHDHGDEIVAICASKTPRDDESSYMPVFTVGHGYAEVLASALGVPLYTTSHQQGHIAAGLIDDQEMNGDRVAIHISGGTTEMLFEHDQNLSLIGGTLDLHAGQLVDRIGVAMGLSFPAGPALEQLAMKATEPARALLGVSFEQKDCYCHLSGAETKALKMLSDQTLSKETIALEVFDFLSRTLCRMILAGCKQTACKQVLIVGGVASSTLLRSLLMERFKKATKNPPYIHFGLPQYSADNAVGIATIGMKRYQVEDSM